MSFKIQDRQLPQPIGVGEAAPYLRELVSVIDAFIREVRNFHNEGKQSTLHLDILDNEPLRPFEGMIVFANGTTFNPGSGRGTYAYENGSWVKL